MLTPVIEADAVPKSGLSDMQVPSYQGRDPDYDSRVVLTKLSVTRFIRSVVNVRNLCASV
jgi:hypothetical protein